MLSGGEKTFVALAGILAMQPQILLLDEPTNGLDQANIERLTALLQQLNLPMIVATHQVDLISALATQ
uniref:ATP-binding cassette domain-containing protein n=1 Tax=Enterococcus faecium TaxID=1352 RepID=UPI0034E974C3